MEFSFLVYSSTKRSYNNIIHRSIKIADFSRYFGDVSHRISYVFWQKSLTLFTKNLNISYSSLKPRICVAFYQNMFILFTELLQDTHGLLETPLTDSINVTNLRKPLRFLSELFHLSTKPIKILQGQGVPVKLSLGIT
jgi:hypothetical protein